MSLNVPEGCPHKHTPRAVLPSLLSILPPAFQNPFLWGPDKLIVPMCSELMTVPLPRVLYLERRCLEDMGL